LDTRDLKILYHYDFGSFQVCLGNKNHMLPSTDSKGKEYVVSAGSLVQNRYMRTVEENVESILYSAMREAGYLALCVFSIVAVIFLIKGRKFTKDADVRGGKLISKQALCTLIEKDNKEEAYNGYRLVDIPYPSHSEMMHTLICGSTGSGKTVLISDLIAQIRARGDRAIIFDKMGTYTERFFEPKKDIILNPFDERAPNWNIFNEVTLDAGFDAIAAAFIPFEKSGADPFWTKAARTIFAEVCISLKKQGVFTNQILVNTLLKKSLEDAAKLVKGTAAQAIIDEKSPKTALSVMSVLATYLKCLKFLRDEGDIFSIREWIRDENASNCIFIPSTGDLHSTLTPLISAWIEIAINNILSLERSRQRKIWLIIDELPSLHTLPSLEQGLAEVRQFGGCFVLSIQSISQLRDRYGINGAQTLSSLCNNKVFLRAGDPDSARWYSDSIGTSEIEEFRESLSYGAHEMRDGVNLNKHKLTKHLVLPSELLNLKEREGYFCMSKSYGVAKVEFAYKDWPILNNKFVRASIAEAPQEEDRHEDAATLEDEALQDEEQNEKEAAAGASFQIS
ncbi:MAG: type IV secretion system DNA-binding domain-containing protein, partial [Alphaproteobacteria bacterium]